MKSSIASRIVTAAVSLTLTTSAYASFGNTEGRIVGGHEVETAPAYMAMVNTGAVCGGTFINSEWVVTAAHCILNDGGMVLYGGKTVSYANGLSIKESIIHPEYQAATTTSSHAYDIALVRVDPVELSEYAQLPTAGEEYTSGQEMTVSGWGVLEEGGIFSSSVLREVTIPYVDMDTCKSNMYMTSDDRITSICAGDPSNEQYAGMDSCQGDSGGPLIVAGTNELAGIVSWGYGCAREGTHGVYAKVSHFIDWINETISAAEAPTPEEQLADTIAEAAELGIIIPDDTGSDVDTGSDGFILGTYEEMLTWYGSEDWFTQMNHATAFADFDQDLYDAYYGTVTSSSSSEGLPDDFIVSDDGDAEQSSSSTSSTEVVIIDDASSSFSSSVVAANSSSSTAAEESYWSSVASSAQAAYESSVAAHSSSVAAEQAYYSSVYAEQEAYNSSVAASAAAAQASYESSVAAEQAAQSSSVAALAQQSSSTSSEAVQQSSSSVPSIFDEIAEVEEEAPTFMMEFDAGWNLIAIPTMTAHGSATLGAKKIWGYLNGAWDGNLQLLEPEKGYWVKVSGRRTFTFEGEEYAANSRTTNNEWQLRGAGSDINVATKYANSTVWTYDEGTWTKNPETIHRGQGYWVK